MAKTSRATYSRQKIFYEINKRCILTSRNFLAKLQSSAIFPDVALFLSPEVRICIFWHYIITGTGVWYVRRFIVTSFDLIEQTFEIIIFGQSREFRKLLQTCCYVRILTRGFSRKVREINSGKFFTGIAVGVLGQIPCLFLERI